MGLSFTHADMQRGQNLVKAFSDISLSDGDQSAAFPPYNLTSVVNAGDSSDVGNNVSPVFGYAVLKFLNIEFTYNSFKDSTQNLSTTSKYSGDNQYNYIFTNKANVSDSSYNLMIDLHHAIYKSFVGNIKAGASYIQQSIHINSTGAFSFTGNTSLDEKLWNKNLNETDSILTPAAGLGLQYYLPFEKKFSITLDWLHYFGVSSDYEFANPTKADSSQILVPSNTKINVNKLPSFDTMSLGIRYDF